MISTMISLLKTVALTGFLIFLLQVKIGENTLDNQIYSWIQGSEVIAPFRDVSQQTFDSSKNIFLKLISKITHSVDKGLGDSDLPGKRSLGVRLERSGEYIKDQKQKAEKALESLNEVDSEEGYSSSEE